MTRPRTVPTDTILRAAYGIIMSEGPRALTFSRLSAEFELVPAALVKRFKSKRQLLVAVDCYALEQSNSAMQHTLQLHGSPIDAIIAMLVNELSFATSTENFVHGQSFLLLDFTYPELYVNYRVSVKQRHQHIVELLGQAQKKGILQPAVPVEELARMLQLVQQGAGHLWAMTQEEPIAAYMERYIRFALQPYLLDDS